MFPNECYFDSAALIAARGVSGNQIALLAVMLAAAVLSVIAYFRRRQRGPSPRTYAREQSVRLAETKGVHDDLAEIMAHLRGLAQEINAQLDAKFLRLERGIRDADERIDRLNRMLRRADGAPALDVVVSDEHVESFLPAARNDPTDRERVLALANEGRTASQIAQEVDRPIGEVRLIMALRSTKGKPLFAIEA